MLYFAYGSNMSLARLRRRVPSAMPLGGHSLGQHDLRFHKSGADGSGKCDAYFTGKAEDTIHGALFEIRPPHKQALDEAEGLGFGYDEKRVEVVATNGTVIEAFTYVATDIDEMLKPYSWYMNQVFIGANETSLPAEYIRQKIMSVACIEDRNHQRDERERLIHSDV